MSFPPIIVQVVLAVLVLVAAVYDFRFRRIPNWLTLSGVLVGIGLNWFLYWDAVKWPRSALLGLGLAFLIYFPLYLLRGMGAGDVKLMAAVGAVVGPANWFGIFILSSVLGGLAAVFLVMYKGRLAKTFSNVGYMLSEMAHFRAPYSRREELDLGSPKAVKMPHGLAIALGSVAFLAAAWIWGRH
jgi:prepilin peptidase CpaA